MWWWLLSLSALTRCIRPYRSAASEIVSFLFKGSGPSRFPNDNRNCIWIYIILVEFRWISSSGGVAASPEAMQKSFFFVPNEGKVIFQDKKKKQSPKRTWTIDCSESIYSFQSTLLSRHKSCHNVSHVV